MRSVSACSHPRVARAGDCPFSACRDVNVGGASVTQSMVVGPVGLGVMDAPMVRHLARMGQSLRLHDADMALARMLGTAAVACDTPAAPFRQGVVMVDAPVSGAQRGAEA